MDKKEDSRISLVILLIVVTMLFSASKVYGYEGNSTSYDVVVSGLSMAGYEETDQPTQSIEVNMDIMPVGEGNSSSNYTVLLGLSKILGPIAFDINITPHIAKNDSIVNCTGFEAFSQNQFEIPKHYYRFTDGIGAISTNWSESGILDCSSVGECKEPNLTCHFKVDDSHLNSTEITKTIAVGTTSPSISLISPDNSKFWNESLRVTFEYNVTDKLNVTGCELIIDGVSLQSTNFPLKETTLNFIQYVKGGNHTWRVDCTNEPGNRGSSEERNLTQIDEKISLSNIGATGFIETNQDYTYTIIVISNLSYPPTASYCRFGNEPGNWTEWNECEKISYWTLIDGIGNKTVFAEINHTGIDYNLTLNYSDWIILEPNGTHLDITPPQNFTVFDDAEFTNKNDSLHFWWNIPKDLESEILNRSISYDYILTDTNGTYMTEWSHTEELETTISGITLAENHKYRLIVNATNPASLKVQSESNGTTIDLSSPEMTGVFGPDNTSFSNSGELFFNWTANDTISGVAGYSMVLDNDNETQPDMIPETEYSNNRTYTDKEDGVYYFHIRPYDNAGNFGDTIHYGPLRIDRTPPSEPIPINPIELAVFDKITFYWQASQDDLSGMKGYNITITDNNTVNINNNFTTFLNYIFSDATPGTEYFLVVKAIDNAGNEMSSEFPKTTQLQIISASPDGSTVAGEPIIKVETNKAAICKESFTNKNFAFTNSTYHETRLEQGDGPYSLVLTCHDNDGFYITKTVNYDVDSTFVPGDVTIGTINDTYIGKTVNATITGLGVGQITREKFRAYINDVEFYDFTINDIDDAGEYSLQFASKEAGEFTLKVEVEGASPGTESFTIKDLNLNVEYTGASNAAPESHLIYATGGGSGNKKVGLASDSKQVTPSSDSGANKIMLNSSTEGKTYIFFTKDNINAKTKDFELKNNEFTKNTNSFGYPADDNFNIRTSLEYDNIIIQGLKELSNGVYSLFIKNIGQNNKNQTIITVELE